MHSWLRKCWITIFISIIIRDSTASSLFSKRVEGHLDKPPQEITSELRPEEHVEYERADRWACDYGSRERGFQVEGTLL